MKRLALLFVLFSLALLVRSEAQAEDEKYRYKFPCYSPDSCFVTQLAHGSNNALDIDIGGSGAIPAMAQSIVVTVDNFQTACSYPAAGLGINAVLWDIDNRVTTYAHLSSASVAANAPLFQGDQVGVEGDSGYTYSTGPGGVIIPCARHLHWQPGSLPAYINGLAVSSLTASPTNYGNSNSNSLIGEYSAAGTTLRNYYINNGGWNSIGWTHDHCPGACKTLNMIPNLSWGRMQDFRHHPDGFGGQFNTIHVANWDPANTAYLVDSAFWAAWAAGGLESATGLIKPISMAREERHAGCPALSTPSCVQFQKFHVGYVWMEGAFAGTQAVFCPDVAGGPGFTPDGKAALGDVTFISLHMNSFGPPSQSGPWSAQADVNGDNRVSLADITQVSLNWNAFCRP